MNKIKSTKCMIEYLLALYDTRGWNLWILCIDQKLAGHSHHTKAQLKFQLPPCSTLFLYF